MPAFEIEDPLDNNNNPRESSLFRVVIYFMFNI